MARRNTKRARRRRTGGCWIATWSIVGCMGSDLRRFSATRTTRSRPCQWYRCDMPTALITGTSTGIGLETALLFTREGYRVYAGARKPEVIEQHPNIVPMQLDVDSEDSVLACVIRVLRAAGQIDVLVNNAGVGLAGAVEMVPLESVRALFETNFYGAVRMMQAVLPSMRGRRSGIVVNVTSMMDRITFGYHAFYAASKFALASVSESLAMEIEPFGVKVAIIEPGVILTPIWNKGGDVMPDGHPYQRARQGYGGCSRRRWRAERNPMRSRA